MNAVLLALTAAALLLSPQTWTRFRLNAGLNAVVPGTLSVRWTKATGGSYSSSLTLAGGILYAANNDGTLFALDPATGKTRWTYRAFNDLMSEPLVWNGLVIEGEGNEVTGPGTPEFPVRVGSGSRSLFAVDARSGALRWRVLLAGTGMPTSAIIGNVLVHHGGAGYVDALAPATGQLLYRIFVDSAASMSAAVPTGGDRYVTAGAAQNAYFELHANAPSIVWKTPFAGTDGATGDCPPALSYPLLYCNYLTSHRIALRRSPGETVVMHAFALDVRGGRVVWDTPLESGILGKRNEAAIPLTEGGTVYEGSAIGPFMHALDARTGRLRWRTRVAGRVKGGSVLADGTLYFGDHAGWLYALDARTGRIRGKRRFATAFDVGSPIIAGRTLIIGGGNGLLVAVPLDQI